MTDPTRDTGVSEAVWQHLRKDKQLADAQQREFEKTIQAQEEARKLAEQAIREAEKATAALQEVRAKDEAETM